MQKPIFLNLYLILVSFTIVAQTDYPQNYFRSPVDVPLSLAGNFGEIRPNHFHAGFDIKTNNREGMPIYAVADGYVSRIKISPFGYGKAIYITHPNGYTSVYGHLKSFNLNIQNICFSIQSLHESFEIDSLLPSNLLIVRKGELIGLSGNTGGSEGPHLHFEIRDSKTEVPINPYFFGYKIEDNIPPKITQLVIYPNNESASIDGKNNIKKIVPQFIKGKYSLLKKDTILVHGDIGFGIECFDIESNSTSPNGVFSVELQSGGKRIYYYEFEKFSFENARYVNTHIDYAAKQKNGSKIQKSFLSKNNLLEIYKNVINGGIIHFSDDSIHWMRYIVKDYFGNTTELMFKLKSTSKNFSKTESKKTPSSQLFFDCLKENKFSTNDIDINIPSDALYDDTYFKYSKTGSIKGTYSPVHQIMNYETALQKAILISIQVTNLPAIHQTKACIISIDKKGKKNYEGGTYTDGWVKTQSKSFGKFAVTVDTVPPILKPAFKDIEGQTPNLINSKTIGIYANDNLSGIKKYHATIDGKWVLCEYECKQNLLFYTFDEKISPGVHYFNLEVTDDKKNYSNIGFTFKR